MLPDRLHLRQGYGMHRIQRPICTRMNTCSSKCAVENMSKTHMPHSLCRAQSKPTGCTKCVGAQWDMASGCRSCDGTQDLK